MAMKGDEKARRGYAFMYGKGDKVKFREYLGVIPFTWKYTPPDKKKPCGELSISTVKATKRVGP